jgi:alkylation response protein AidB-like acyl-CoA dehydrogenase
MTKAVRDGGDYIINGRKCFVTNGGLADIYTVAASTDPSKGSLGISLFIVDRDTPGVSIGKKEDKLGIRASNTCDVVFEDVRVPASNMVGEENTGYKTMLTLLARTRPTGMAPAVGLAQHAMDLALDYVRQRETFGAPIGTRQGIQFKIAEMETAITVARSQVIYNATLIDRGVYDSTLGAMTKLHVSEMVNKVCYDALQLYGGYGFSKEYPLEKLYRDARIYPIFEGTNEIQRMLIGSRTIGKINK